MYTGPGFAKYYIYNLHLGDRAWVENHGFVREDGPKSPFPSYLYPVQST